MQGDFYTVGKIARKVTRPSTCRRPSTSIVTLLTPEGEIAFQSAVLGSADPELLAALQRLP